MRLKTSFRVKKSGNLIFHSGVGDFYLMENFCVFDRKIFFFIELIKLKNRMLIEHIKSLKFLTCCVNLRNITPKCAECVKQVAPPIMRTRDRQHFLHTKIEKKPKLNLLRQNHHFTFFPPNFTISPFQTHRN